MNPIVYNPHAYAVLGLVCVPCFNRCSGEKHKMNIDASKTKELTKAVLDFFKKREPSVSNVPPFIDNKKVKIRK